jgi:hypothetical protein
MGSGNIPVRLTKFERNFTKHTFCFVTQIMSKRNFCLKRREYQSTFMKGISCGLARAPILILGADWEVCRREVDWSETGRSVQVDQAWCPGFHSSVFLAFLMSISGVEIWSCIIVFLMCINLFPISMQNCSNCQMYLSFSMDVEVFSANKIRTA